MSFSHHAIVDQQFGSRAQAYVASATHASGPDLERLVELAKGGGQVLDLGCGGGHATYAVAPGVQRVTACDLSQQMLDAVEAEAARRGFANVETVRAAAEALPFETAAFDMVICRLSAHHWLDLDAGLREARRVLKSGGLAVFIDVIAPDHPVFDTHLQAVELLRDPSHVRDYRIGEWAAAVERAGFTMQRMQMHDLPMDFAGWVGRMQTVPEHVAAIRSLQTGASDIVRRAFDIREDGSFTIRVALFELTANRL